MGHNMPYSLIIINFAYFKARHLIIHAEMRLHVYIADTKKQSNPVNQNNYGAIKPELCTVSFMYSIYIKQFYDIGMMVCT